MAFNQDTNLDSVGLIGSNGYKSENLKHLHKIAFVTPGHEFATQTLAETQSEWYADIKQTTGTTYISPVIVEMADNTGDAQVVEFPNGDKRTISLADYDFTGYWDVPHSVVRKLFTLNNKSLDCYFIWQDKSIQGYTPDETKFAALRVKELVVVKVETPMGGNVQRVMFAITLDEKDDYEKDRVFVYPFSNASWNPMSLDSLRGVDLVAADAADSYKITLTIKDEHGVGVAGLSTTPGTDIVATGGTNTVITDDGGGTYTCTMSDGTSTTFNLVAAASISVSDAFIKSNGASNAIAPTNP